MPLGQRRDRHLDFHTTRDNLSRSRLQAEVGFFASAFRQFLDRLRQAGDIRFGLQVDHGRVLRPLRGHCLRAGRRDALGCFGRRLGRCRGACTACATTTGRWSPTNGSPARRVRRAGATTRRCSPPTAAPRRVSSTSRPTRPGGRSGWRCARAAGLCAAASLAARRCGSARGHPARTRARTPPQRRGLRDGPRGSSSRWRGWWGFGPGRHRGYGWSPSPIRCSRR